MNSRLLFIVILVTTIVFLGGCCYSKNISTDTSEIRQVDEKIILDYLDNKTNDLASSQRGKMFSAFMLLGTTHDKIYLWVTKIEYLNVGNKITHEGGDAVSAPIVLSVKKTDTSLNIISHKFPEDGKNFGKDVKRLFPPNIQFPQNEDKVRLEEITKTRAEEDLLN